MNGASDGLRFDPPRLRPSPELLWVLDRAFGPPDASLPPPPDSGRALDLARTLDVLGRIASRVPAATLCAEIGPVALESALDERRQVAFWALRVLKTARQVAETAAELDLPVAFLKGAALHLAQHVPLTARRASDVDVLSSAEDATALQSALLARGFHAPGPSASDYHLAPLVRDDALPVEVHLWIRGCPLPGAPSATLDSLDRAGLLQVVPGLPGRARIPVPAFLAAHALVHGIEDHGFGADRYPPLRMLCDLADLLAVHAPGALAVHAPDVPSRAQIRPLTGPEISSTDFHAVLDLVDFLIRGTPGPSPDRRSPFDRLPDARSPAGLMLAHLIAGATDPDYREALRLRQVAWLLRTRPLAALRDKLSFRFGARPATSGPGRVVHAGRHFARLVRAEFRLRMRAWLDR